MKNTSLCYIERGGQYLMLHRTKKKKDINKDKWIGVGGHGEGAESPEDCLLREVKEETGLTISNLELCGICQWTKLCGYRYIVFCYKTKSFTGELLDSKEGHVFWIKKKDLFNYELANDLKELSVCISKAQRDWYFSSVILLSLTNLL